MSDGGTVVAVRGKGFVVMASEKRLSYNGFVLSKATRKIHVVHDRVGIGFVGLHGDAQAIVKILRGEAHYYKLQMGYDMSVRALAKLLSNILYSYKLIPFYVETIVAGIDDKGSHVYVLDPVGSLIEDDYAAIGTGGPIAIGVIEPEYRPDISVEEAEKLVVKAVRQAILRDAVSGDGIDVLVIREGEKPVLRSIVFRREAVPGTG